jgi:hypothetical protein
LSGRRQVEELKHHAFSQFARALCSMLILAHRRALVLNKYLGIQL